MEGIELFERPMREFFELSYGVEKTFSIVLALKFKLFDAIEELGDKAYVKDILKKLKFKTEMRHFYDFLDQLYVNGYLNREDLKEDARYINTDYTKKYLLTSSPYNYANIYDNLYRYIKKFDFMEKEFPNGKTHHFSEDIYNTEEDYKAYYSYFYKTNEMTFEHLLEKVHFPKYRRVVDLHGGNGTLSMSIKRKFPQCEVVSFDNKKCKECVEMKLKGNEMFNAVKLEFGNILSDKLPTSDCFIAPHILVHFNCENKKKACKNIFNSLDSYGDLLLVENLTDENRNKDNCALKMSFMLGAMGDQGAAHSFEEWKSCLTSVGFKDVRRIDSGELPSAIIVANKQTT